MLIHNPQTTHPFETWTFQQYMTITGKTYRQIKNRQTLSFTAQNKPYFIKRFQGTNWLEILKELIQGRLPITSAYHEWQAIQHLQQLNIDTMQWTVYGHKKHYGIHNQSFLVTEALQNTQSLEDYCQNWATTPPPPNLKRKIITQLATTSRILHTNGLNHRDYYLCHFLLDQTTLNNPHPKIHLIDLHRMQKRNKTPSRWIIKDIGSLYFSAMDCGLTKKDLLRYIKTYQNQPLREALKKTTFWTKVTAKAQQLYYKMHQCYATTPFERQK